MVRIFSQVPNPQTCGGWGGGGEKTRKETKNILLLKNQRPYKARKRTIYNCELFFQNSSHVSGMDVSLWLSGFVCLYVWCRGQ